MGHPRGFLEYEREAVPSRPPLERTGDFAELHGPPPADGIRLQASRCMNCGVPFCHGIFTGCTLCNKIPEWNDLVYLGHDREAYLRLAETNPFPEFTGRVCPALCEGSCTCGLDGKAVTIRDIELYLAETAFERGWVRPEPPPVRSAFHVAVVGSGPAGLAAAYRLNRLGHRVTVYERADRPGGLLEYGIPNMKLDKAVVARRIRVLQAEGIVFESGVEVGRDLPVERLVQENHAVLLAQGATIPRDLPVPGRDLEGIRFAVPFLWETTAALLEARRKAVPGTRPDWLPPLLEGKRVVVIGGGDTGNDCVATALRLGAASVRQLELLPRPAVERRPGNPWPLWPFTLKTDYGQEEAAAHLGGDPREFGVSTVAFTGTGGHLDGLDVVTVEWQDRKPVPAAGTERHLPADLVLLAMGFVGSETGLLERLGAGKGSSYETTRPGVFLCGDMRTGQSLVLKAMEDGLSAARAVDARLRKGGA